MHTIDLAIIGLYCLGMLAIGLWHSRVSADSTRAYFLGENKGKWWMLAASGAASNFDVSGTMFMVSLFYLVGLRAFWLLWAYQLFNSAFLMSYMAVWIRRTRVMTAVELMLIRFGSDRGGKFARTAGAVLMVTFLTFSIGFAYAGLCKFIPPLFPEANQQIIKYVPLAIMIVTTAYVTIGGFKSVVMADVIQLAMSGTAGIIIGVTVFLKLDPGLVKELHAHFAAEFAPRMVMHLPPSNSNWNNFGLLCIYWAVAGLLLNMSGAGGHYGEQRFLATRSNSDAAKAGCAWGLFSMPRWAMIAGFVFIASTGLAGSKDPETILPIIIIQILPVGLKGALVAALAAAFMSSFGSVVNAAASMVICDVIQPAKPHLSTKFLVRLSYVVSLSLVATGIVIGSHADSLGSLWTWMIAAIIGATLIPNVLRWHWWRFNGWGYACGIFGGLGAALVIAVGQAMDWWGGRLEYQFAPIIWAFSMIGAVAGSLLTKPTSMDTLKIFYGRVRPFGFWQSVKVLCEPEPVKDSIAAVALNVVVGLAGFFSCTSGIFFLIGHYFYEFSVCVSITATCAVVLYYNWYRKLPSD